MEAAARLVTKKRQLEQKGKFTAMRNNESWCFDRASRGGLTRAAAKRRRVLSRCSLNSEKRGRRAKKKSEHRLLEQLLLTKRKKRKNLHPSLSGRHLASNRSSWMEGRGGKTRRRQEDVWWVRVSSHVASLSPSLALSFPFFKSWLCAPAAPPSPRHPSPSRAWTPKTETVSSSNRAAAKSSAAWIHLNSFSQRQLWKGIKVEVSGLV